MAISMEGREVQGPVVPIDADVRVDVIEGMPAAGVKANAQSTDRRSQITKTILVVMTVVSIVFVFTLPLLSYLFNDVLGFNKVLCETPASLIVCGNGLDYEKFAEETGRFNEKLQMFVGCSCEDGIFGDWACPVDLETFSISQYISTAPATGAMAAVSFWPILGMWTYGAGHRDWAAMQGANDFQKDIAFYTLLTFQLFFGLFLINTLCIAPSVHFNTTFAFILSMVVHYIAVAMAVGTTTFEGKLICGLLFFGVGAFLTGFFWPVDNSWLGQHAFWLGECSGLSAGFSLAPVLIVYETSQAWLAEGASKAREPQA